MLDCPKCLKQVNKLTIPLEGKLGCVECNGNKSVPFNVNLGQTLDSYIRKDGTKAKITVGKDWEMSNRRVSQDDNRTVYNKVTGQLPQY